MRMNSLLFPALALTLCFACGDDGGDGNIDAAGIDAAVDAANNGICRQSAECPPNEGCVGPNDLNCGIPPQEQCASSQDCFNNDVCHAIADSCSGDGVGSMCGPACTPGDLCSDGFVCGAAGACLPVACDDPTFDCRVSEVCDPTSIDPANPVHAITHGCTMVTCTDDGPCANGTVCVNGYCQDGLGMCALPAP